MSSYLETPGTELGVMQIQRMYSAVAPHYGQRLSGQNWHAELKQVF